MLLNNKIAVIYGAGGSVGSVVAKTFAQEGATVILAGRTDEKLARLAAEIISSGRAAGFAKVDALDGQQVEAHLESVIRQFGRIDISFNLIGMEDVQGISLAEMDQEHFIAPIDIAMRSQFLTATAAARKMKASGGGVILMLSANAGRKPFANTGGFGVACAAIEALSRQLAVELGMFGVRVVCLRSAGSPDAAGVSQVFDEHAKLQHQTREEFEKEFAASTMLKFLPSLRQVANVAVLMASDRAAPVTASVVNVTCGELAD